MNKRAYNMGKAAAYQLLTRSNPMVKEELYREKLAAEGINYSAILPYLGAVGLGGVAGYYGKGYMDDRARAAEEQAYADQQNAYYNNYGYLYE